jgi:GNAT superfamily N-acetyltransferase
MSYHFFSDEEFAGPHPSDILRFWDRSPRQLRPEPRKTLPKFRLPHSQTYAKATKAAEEDALEISSFWCKHYTGADWTFRCSADDVNSWLQQGFILVLRDKGRIVATFAYRQLANASLGAKRLPAALLDGLVVHPDLRQQGVASFLLASMDYTVYSDPVQPVLFWFREHASSLNAVIQAPICVFQYCYIKLSDVGKYAGQATRVQTVPAAVNGIIERERGAFTAAAGAVAGAAGATNSHNILWFLIGGAVVGIADTHRIDKQGNTIWEVVFAANTIQPHFTGLQEAIEAAAAALPCTKGVVFASNSKSRGNLLKPSAPWVTGTSGHLSLHIYNYMPPTFLTGDIMMPVDCI